MGWYPESNASFSIGRLRHLQLSIGKTNIYYVTWIELLISKINKHVITDNYSWYLESKSHTLYKWGKQQNLDGTSWLGGYLESSPFLFCEEEKLTFPKPYHPWDWHISLQVPSKSTNVSKCSVSTTIHSWMVWIISHTWVCPRDDQSRLLFFQVLGSKNASCFSIVLVTKREPSDLFSEDVLCSPNHHQQHYIR